MGQCSQVGFRVLSKAGCQRCDLKASSVSAGWLGKGRFQLLALPASWPGPQVFNAFLLA